MKTVVRAALPLALALSALGCARPPARSVVLVIVDTLRADHLGAYGYQRPTTPELDRRLAEAAVFDNALATSPWTLASVGSIFTGRLPERHGAGFKFGRQDFSGLDPAAPTLAGILAGEGYVTGAIVTNVYLGPRFGLDRGFGELLDRAGDDVTPPSRADEVVDEALAWIAARGEEPFFLTLHLLDPHLPYDAPPPVRGRFTASYEGPLALPFDRRREVRAGRLAGDAADRRFIAAAYDEEVAFVDRELGRLFEALGAAGLLETGVVIFTSDHGEELFDHGDFEHGHSVYQEVLRVPLAIWGAGVEPARHPTPASLVDLLPTTLDALGLEIPAGTEGASLWPLVTGGAPPPARRLGAQWSLHGPQRQALVEWPYKLAKNRATGRLQLFDLERDPAERRDLSALESDRLDRLHAALAELLPHRRPSEQPVELDEATRRQLEALGYID